MPELLCRIAIEADPNGNPFLNDRRAEGHVAKVADAAPSARRVELSGAD